jgi:hypothetical protein
MKSSILLAALSAAISAPLATSAPVAANAPAPAGWSFAEVMAMIDRAPIRVGHRTLRIDSDTALCSGVGDGAVRNGVRVWPVFKCIYSVPIRNDFYDCSFKVLVLGRSTFRIADTRWVGGSP